MALSMDEQRILAEIEQHLSRAEPKLAARMSSFDARRVTGRFRLRSRALLAVVCALVLAAISVAVYTFVVLRAGQSPGPSHPNRSTSRTEPPALSPLVPVLPHAGASS
jgi:cytoskeletal protein RodZ